MNEEQIFQQVNLVRKATLKVMDSVTEEQVDSSRKDLITQSAGTLATFTWCKTH